jgi:hypothetical protein
MRLSLDKNILDQYVYVVRFNHSRYADWDENVMLLFRCPHGDFPQMHHQLSEWGLDRACDNTYKQLVKSSGCEYPRTIQTLRLRCRLY